MSFLKTLLWIVVAVLIALFCFNNWTVVAINLWNGLILETKLPLLLGAAFLLGFLPTLLLWQAARWRLRRRVEMAPSPTPLPLPVIEPSPRAAPLTAVPPGGA